MTYLPLALAGNLDRPLVDQRAGQIQWRFTPSGLRGTDQVLRRLARYTRHEADTSLILGGSPVDMVDYQHLNWRFSRFYTNPALLFLRGNEGPGGA